MKELAIIIPARYDSKRLLGKPLIKINGKEMLAYVWEIAQHVVCKDVKIYNYVATEDDRIMQFCKANGIDCIMTSKKCKTGSDRVLEAALKLEEMGYNPSFVINLQGDNPLCPWWFLTELIEEYLIDRDIEIVTPIIQLSWQALDELRRNKIKSPFSGTCVTFDKHFNALYFSKNIIPSIRNETFFREKNKMSPIYKQTGIYGYKISTLKKINSLQEGVFESFESLEQLRFLENGIHIKCKIVNYRKFQELMSFSGVDDIEDLKRVQNYLKTEGNIYERD